MSGMRQRTTPLRFFTRTEEFDFDLGGETVKIRAENVPLEKCDQCGEVMSGPAAAKVQHEAICRAIGLMTPSDIKTLREGFGWSQQYLADLTDFGIATVSRWERGRLLQNRSANKVLLALRDCQAFRAYLEELVAPKTEIAPSPHPVFSRNGPIKQRYRNAKSSSARVADETAFQLRIVYTAA